MATLANGKVNGNGLTNGNDKGAFSKTEDPSPLTRSLGYGKGLTAMVFGKRILLFNGEYLIGKHGTGTSSAGSKLGDVDSEEKLVKLLGRYVDEMALSSCTSVVRLANIPCGYVAGSDALVQIVSLKKGGEDVPAGTPLEPGVEYAARVKDADGAEYDAVLGYEVTRPASPDGKFPAIMQPVAHTDKSPPNTEKLNIVIGKIDPKDEKAAWLEPAALEEKLGSLDGYEGVYAVFTIFPGTYSPAANEPISSQVDTVMGITGNEFWRSHALLKK